MEKDTNKLLRNIPKVDEFLSDKELVLFESGVSRERFLSVLRAQTERLRANPDSIAGLTKQHIFELIKSRVSEELESFSREKLRRVINATGIIIHTNLGRAPLPKEAGEKLAEICAGYSNLEYSVVEAKRRSRLLTVEKTLCDLTGAEAALVVNNNAAAVLLSLHTLASNREVILSRGEIVEIGDSFRISEIIETSGCKIKEVGTTNITRLQDYEHAISENTAMLLKVHSSNFKITGFTVETDTAELAALAAQAGIIIMEDMGSGVLTDVSRYGMRYERQVSDALSDGAGIVTISGDKMLGGPQAGIILGKKIYIEKLRRNQLMRCLRIDKLCLAALEAVLSLYSEKDGFAKIPVLHYAFMEQAELLENTRKFLRKLDKKGALKYEIKEHSAQLGGGSMPSELIRSWGIYISSVSLSPNEIDRRLRALPVPVIATTQNHEVILDLRTVERSDYDYIARSLNSINLQ